MGYDPSALALVRIQVEEMCGANRCVRSGCGILRYEKAVQSTDSKEFDRRAADRNNKLLISATIIDARVRPSAHENRRSGSSPDPPQE